MESQQKFIPFAFIQAESKIVLKVTIYTRMVPDIIENPQMALEFVIDKSLKFIKRKKKSNAENNSFH
ncbi:hypothetical protein DERF_010861 [Dermatophagoides farinae]|uniref:Uncharacterized protein n=1 Tax=Dermatophagoides farinae TaxID=6954 RepID=A0A922HRV5_DERFA|nr:hypothetical protein DERF_010861 [Dermatophagoides farinae]